MSFFPAAVPTDPTITVSVQDYQLMCGGKALRDNFIPIADGLASGGDGPHFIRALWEPVGVCPLPARSAYSDRLRAPLKDRRARFLGKPLR